MTLNQQPTRSESSKRHLLDDFTLACLVASGIVCLVSALFFLFHRYPDYLHSDAAGIVLHAEEIVRSKQWIPTAWHYVSDTIFFLDHAHLAIPFVAALGPTKLAFSCAASLCLLLFLGSTYALGRSAGLPRLLAVMASLLMISGASMIYSDLLLGMMMTPYFAATALLLLTIVAGFRVGNHERSAWISAAIVLFLFSTNPRKAFIFHALPAAAAMGICAYRLGKQEAAGNIHERSEFLLRALFYSSCVGALVHAFVLPLVLMDDSYAQHPFSLDVLAVADNFRIFRTLSWKFLGFTEDGNAIPEGLRVTIVMYRIATAAVLLSFFILGALAAFRRRNVGCQLIATYSIAAAALIVVALLTGNKIKQYYGIYYLIIAIVPATIVSFFYISILPKHIRNITLLVIVAPTLLLSTRNHVFGNPAYPGPGINQKTSNSQKYRLIDWLEKKGLHNGYSAYWEASAITVLSDARIRVVPAKPWPGGLTPFAWGVSQYQLDRMALQRPVFVAVPYPTKSIQMLEQCPREAIVHEVAPYRVYVFNDGLAGCLFK